MYFMLTSSVLASGVKQRHVLETGKYPFVSPSSVSMKDIVDISGTARYPLAKLHGEANNNHR